MCEPGLTLHVIPIIINGPKGEIKCNYCGSNQFKPATYVGRIEKMTCVGCGTETDGQKTFELYGIRKILDD